MTAAARVLLIGMMGAGKTTTGNLVAARLGWPYLDSDDDVEAATGLTVPEIFTPDGEAAFRDEEARCWPRLQRGRPSVVSVAGGAVLNAQTAAGSRRAARWCGCGPVPTRSPLGWARAPAGPS